MTQPEHPIILQRHFDIIIRHVRAMFDEIAVPYLGRRITSARDTARIADEHVEFIAALREFVRTIGSDEWPEIELEMLPPAE